MYEGPAVAFKPQGRRDHDPALSQLGIHLPLTMECASGLTVRGAPQMLLLLLLLQPKYTASSSRSSISGSQSQRCALAPRNNTLNSCLTEMLYFFLLADLNIQCLYVFHTFTPTFYFEFKDCIHGIPLPFPKTRILR